MFDELHSNTCIEGRESMIVFLLVEPREMNLEELGLFGAAPHFVTHGTEIRDRWRGGLAKEREREREGGEKERAEKYICL